MPHAGYRTSLGQLCSMENGILSGTRRRASTAEKACRYVDAACAAVNGMQVHRGRSAPQQTVPVRHAAVVACRYVKPAYARKRRAIGPPFYQVLNNFWTKILILKVN